MLQLVMVGIGGFCGAIARYALSGWMQKRFPDFAPSGTLLVNVLGCLLIGVLMTLAAERNLSPNMRLILITGFLGSLTTFSTFGYETVALVRADELRMAVMNVAANCCVGFAAVVAGIGIVRVWSS